MKLQTSCAARGFSRSVGNVQLKETHWSP